MSNPIAVPGSMCNGEDCTIRDTTSLGFCKRHLSSANPHVLIDTHKHVLHHGIWHNVLQIATPHDTKVSVGDDSALLNPRYTYYVDDAHLVYAGTDASGPVIIGVLTDNVVYPLTEASIKSKVIMTVLRATGFMIGDINAYVTQ